MIKKTDAERVRKMKRVICEVCRGLDILKDNGVFVCQSCGCKYTLEEVRKMLAEDDSIQQTPGTLPPAEQTGEYANTLKATRDAMMDGRFDSAYTNSIRLIAMKPDIPELIAIQALSILGKEKMTLDIPASTCKGMERFYTMFGTWKAAYSEQVKAIRNVQSYVDLACQAQVAALRGEIPELESQKYESTLVDGITQLKDTIGMLNGDLYSTMHGIDRERDDRWREEDNRLLDNRIAQTREKERKVEAFRTDQTERLAKLLQSAQDAFTQAKEEKADERSSRQDHADAENYTVISDREIICNQCGSLQQIRRIKGVCWKCGARFSAEQSEAAD